MGLATHGGKIIIIEGVWGAGKTTLITEMSKRLGAVIIDEPDHRISNAISPLDITQWYFEAHNDNLEMALGLARNGQTVLIERCAAYSAAFSEVYQGVKPSKEGVSRMKTLLTTARDEGIGIELILLPPRDLDETVVSMFRHPHLGPLADKEKIIKVDELLTKIVDDIKGELCLS